MTLPRQVLPGRFYMVTRRCVQRQFLLRPDEDTNNAFLYCLAYAADCTGVEVILPLVMSNHHHTVVFDRDGSIIEFITCLHRLVAKCQNVRRGRGENFWSTEEPSLLRLIDHGDVLAKLAYTATNPITSHLVDRVHHWPGLNGLAALLADRPLTARRPTYFFRPDGPMPETAVLRLVIPPELGRPDDIRRQLRDLVSAIEESVAELRVRNGNRVLGRRGVLQQSWRDQPRTEEARGTLRPRLAARNIWSRVEALLRDREFIAAYRAARARWLDGLPATFPVGTYWLRRYAGVPIAA